MEYQKEKEVVMSFLSGDNKDIGKPQELSIFASPPNQGAVEKVTYTEKRPISNLINDSTPWPHRNSCFWSRK